MTRIAIVGGGVSGLATGLAIRDRAAREGREVEVVVLEKEDRAGGKVHTETIDGYVCEWGPNGFLDNVPETLELVRRLGIVDRLQPSDDAARKRFLYHRGRLHAAPGGIGAFLTSGLLSARGKLRLMAEPLVPGRRFAHPNGGPVPPPAPDEDESIRSFAARRIGSEGADVMIDALVSGIFAGDPSRLSLRACFPKMFQMESEHGGLVRAMLASRKSKRRGEGLASMRPVPAGSVHAPAPAPDSTAPGATAKGGGMGMPAGTLTSFRGGIEELITALAREMGSSVHPGVTIAGVARGEGAARWSVVRNDGATLDADAVVLAGPAAVSSRLLADLDPALAAVLGEIVYASVVVVCLGFDAASLAGPLDGFGFLVPRGEGVRILGTLWDSSIYPGRAPAGRVLMRAMIGGARDPEAAELSDAALQGAVLGDLKRTMGLTATPAMVRIFRHHQGIPQYTLGHLDRIRRIDEGLSRHPGVFVAGNSYRGVAINSCIAEAPSLAGRVLDFVS